jgi:hypothetical protein
MATLGHNSMVDMNRKRAKRVYRLARLLDSQFRIPGTDIRFGLDSILGLIPGAGDTVTATMAGYIIFEAWRMGVGKGIIARMVGNVVLDWIIGSIPLLGDIFDIGFKASTRNIRLMEDALSVTFKDL